MDIPTDRRMESLENQKTALLSLVQALFCFPPVLNHLNSNAAEEVAKGKPHALGEQSKRQLLFRQGSCVLPQKSPVFVYTNTLFVCLF